MIGYRLRTRSTLPCGSLVHLRGSLREATPTDICIVFTRAELTVLYCSLRTTHTHFEHEKKRGLQPVAVDGVNHLAAFLFTALVTIVDANNIVANRRQVKMIIVKSNGHDPGALPPQSRKS